MSTGTRSHRCWPGWHRARTLFIIASKTFTTQETLANARTAKAWFEAGGGTDIAGHFVGLTTNVEAARAFGIATTFGFWDWVGGRYSLWSAIGLPIAIAIGPDGFRAMLAGAHAMDRHFATTPLERNLPVLLGLLDIWARNFHGLGSRNVAPYHQGLARLPAYLQQLEMESNGKRVDHDGASLPFQTSPVIWGEAGTNGQHAFFQMLHQGTDVVPVDFIAVRRSSHGLVALDDAVRASLEDQHVKLLAQLLGAVAGPDARQVGRTGARRVGTHGRPRLRLRNTARHRSFPGNRPSVTLVLERLDPASLGACCWRCTSTASSPAVRCGASTASTSGASSWARPLQRVLPRFRNGDVSGLDGSTAGCWGAFSAADGGAACQGLVLCDGLRQVAVFLATLAANRLQPRQVLARLFRAACSSGRPRRCTRARRGASGRVPGRACSA